MPPPEHNVNGPPTSAASHLRMIVHINHIIQKPRWCNIQSPIAVGITFVSIPYYASVVNWSRNKEWTITWPLQVKNVLAMEPNKQAGQYNLAIIETRGLLQRTIIFIWYISHNNDLCTFQASLPSSLICNFQRIIPPPVTKMLELCLPDITVNLFVNEAFEDRTTN
jgi:hypothetical protein